MDIKTGVEVMNTGTLASEGTLSTKNVSAHVYPGSGTPEDPFLVDWSENDNENPRCWGRTRRYIMTYQLAMGTLAASFASSAYTGGMLYMDKDLHTNENVSVLGLALYVLGLGLGPFLFAPLSEMYGRRVVFLGSFAPFTLCHLGGALGRNLATILSTRLLAGIFGSSPLTNAGGAISDMWDPSERALPQALYASAPFLGPILGPIVAGYIAQNPHLGWRFTFWVMFMYSALMLILGAINMRETYTPFLLRRRARTLHAESGGTLHYISKLDKGRPIGSFADVVKVNMQRPIVFLVREPIVTLLATYMAIVYAILIAFFAAFPIVFQEQRHFTSGQGGLAFIGIGLGSMLGNCLTPVQNMYYRRAMKKSPDGRAPPEARLVMGCVGAILIPIGMFWFAWTTFPSIHYMVPIVAGVPFGTGMVLIAISIIGYILDTYTIYAASAMAGTVVARSILAAMFPIFTPLMFRRLGTQWAISVFAFLSLICTPLPFIFYRYGPWIRARSKYATSLLGTDTKVNPAVPEVDTAEKHLECA